MVVPHANVHAVPPLPSSFYGNVTLNGADLPEGTIIQALIDGEVYASTASQLYQGNSVYSLIVAGDDPATAAVEGGVAGDTIQFTVGGNLASQTAVWQSGVNLNLDLTASGGVVIPTATSKPTATRTAQPTNTKTSSAPASTSTPYPTVIAPTVTQQVFVTLTLTATETSTQELEEQLSVTPEPTGVTQTTTSEALALTEEAIVTDSMVPQNEKAAGEARENSTLPENEEERPKATWLHFFLPTGILSATGLVIWALQKKKQSDQELL